MKAKALENYLMGIENWEEMISIKNRLKLEAYVLDQIEKAFEGIKGSAISRNIESADLLYVTIAKGKHKKYLHRRLSRTDSLSSYSMLHRKVFAVNGKHNIPKGAKVHSDNFTEYDNVLLIPLIPSYGIFRNPPKIPAVVVLYRPHIPFTQEEVEKAKILSQKYGNIVDLYNHVQLSRLKEMVDKIGKEMIIDAISYRYTMKEFFQKYLEKLVDIVEGAEAGSLLVETPIGFKFIATHGYSENLLNMPPLPKENHIMWYYYGEENMRKGIPRILTKDIIQKLIDKDIVAKDEKRTVDISSTLGIPIVSQGKVVLFINLDNFHLPMAFDDNDIELANQMGVYITAAYEILTNKETLYKREEAMARINRLSSMLSQKQAIPDNQTSIKELLSNILTTEINILNPTITVILDDKTTDPISNGTHDPQLTNFIKNLIPLAKLKHHIIRLYKNQFLLIKAQEYRVEDDSFIIYIAILKEDPWTPADIHYILSILNATAIYVKNISYLRTIIHTTEETIKMLGEALEIRDIETKGHINRTARLMHAMAQALGLDNIRALVWGAYLHDIGKIAIPDRILLKPSKLTKEEFEIIKRHVIYGYDLIKNVHGIPQTTKNIVLYHHEWWNGMGYMRGLKGEDIPLEARIFAVIDVFDALISPRPYKDPWPFDKAIEEIKRLSGVQFDPDIVNVFLDIIESSKVIH